LDRLNFYSSHWRSYVQNGFSNDFDVKGVCLSEIMGLRLRKQLLRDNLLTLIWWAHVRRLSSVRPRLITAEEEGIRILLRVTYGGEVSLMNIKVIWMDLLWFSLNLHLVNSIWFIKLSKYAFLKSIVKLLNRNNPTFVFELMFWHISTTLYYKTTLSLIGYMR